MCHWQLCEREYTTQSRCSHLCMCRQHFSYSCAGQPQHWISE